MKGKCGHQRECREIYVDGWFDTCFRWTQNGTTRSWGCCQNNQENIVVTEAKPSWRYDCYGKHIRRCFRPSEPRVCPNRNTSNSHTDAPENGCCPKLTLSSVLQKALCETSDIGNKYLRRGRKTGSRLGIFKRDLYVLWWSIGSARFFVETLPVDMIIDTPILERLDSCINIGHSYVTVTIDGVDTQLFF